MDLNDVKENRVVDNSFTNWISQWTSCIREIERDSVSVVATELYSSSDVVERKFPARLETLFMFLILLILFIDLFPLIYFILILF